MFEFDAATDRAAKRRQPPPWGALWLTFFSATFAAVLLAGVVLALGVRAYLHWSVTSTVNKIERKLDEKPKYDPPK